MSMGSIGSGVANYIQINEFQNAVIANASPSSNSLGMTGTGSDKTFFTFKLNFNRSSIHLGTQKSNHGLENHILFISKTATNVRLDNTYLRPWHIECLTNYSTADMRNLGGTDDNKMIIIIHVGICCMIFQMAMQNNGGVECAFNNKIRLFLGIADCSINLKGGRFNYISTFMYGRSTICHCSFRSYAYRKFLILYSHSLCGFLSSQIITSNNNGYFIAMIANMIRQKQSVCDILMARIK